MGKTTKGKLISDILQLTGSKPEIVVDGKSLFDRLSDMSAEKLDKILQVCKGLS